MQTRPGMEEGGEDSNVTVSWEHPPQYVIRTRWIVEGVLLPAIGAIGIVGEDHSIALSSGQNLQNVMFETMSRENKMKWTGKQMGVLWFLLKWENFLHTCLKDTGRILIL